MDLVKQVYRFTMEQEALQKDYSLKDQIRRCSVSVPSNIAEGSSRGSTKEFIRFLYIASGSCAELKTQLIIVQSVYPVEKPVADSLIDSLEGIHKMIYSMISALKKKLLV